MKIVKKLSLVGLLIFGTLIQAQDQLRIVGSSTVYPFSSMVAEEFGTVSKFQTPVVESTGTGGGMKLFCNGASSETPDITNASRRMKIKEFHLCNRNGVNDITEIMFGYDGIVLAQSIDNEKLNLTKKDILLAVSAKVPAKDGSSLIKNPYTMWNQINPKLPNREIAIYGPPKSSGTRDAFEEMIMEYQTQDMKVYRDAGLKGYRVIRTDGVYIPSGENDNLIVKKLSKNKKAIGIFGYSFLVENDDKIAAISIDNILPTQITISSKKYPISRSLYFYVKNEHKNKKAQGAYVDMFVSEDMLEEEGILSEIGLIPLTSKEMIIAQDKAKNRIKLTIEELELSNTH